MFGKTLVLFQYFVNTHTLKPKQGWFEILEVVEGMSMKGPVEIEYLVFKHCKHVGLIWDNITIEINNMIGW
jgi:hypothetical protein